MTRGLGGLDAVVALGVVLILVGVGFKLAVVPFHMWTPDIYQGAPAPVTAYIATVSKGAVFALLLRYFRGVSLDQASTLFLVFAAIAVASMVAGNLLALLQDNVKRILAYSSIAHLGYLLVAFLASGERAATAVTFYLVAYIATSLAAFGVVGALSTGGARRRATWTTTAGSPAAIPGSPASWPWRSSRSPGSRSPPASSASSTWSRPARRRPVGAHHRPRADQHGRPLLLHADRGRHVRGAARAGRGRRGRGARAAARPPACRPARSRRPVSASLVLGALTVFLIVFGVYPTPLIRLIERAVSTLP